MLTAYHTDNSSMVDIFIEYGCDVWGINKCNMNVYHFAAACNRHKILDTLCRHDVTNINRGDDTNWTPLYWAARCGNISCVNVLLRHYNIDMAVKDRWGRTAYDMAGRFENNKQNGDKIRRMIKDYKKWM
ncbi:protein phosphatase 1 regulatory inhibitor subunit 16B-like [Hydractinia symbiolongicarpus]|uniref:protein phosphatase 1 regulatory inhibitor subunit 16B-like n=1 Tax=Hydractinia symbiolongicarpus TaxID=13093 RepID=UPI00254FCF5E|nr:protein phosphatase 1 regulatory inhibitor subunit 16B-like [Hydractinia symbiolongicarpus]